MSPSSARSAVEDTLAFMRERPFPTRAPLPAPQPSPSLDTPADADLAYACAHCDALEIEVLEKEHARAWRRRRHHDCTGILKRIKQIKGQAYTARTRVFADGWLTTW